MACFVNILPQCIPICDYLECVVGVSSSSSGQHTDLKPSRLACDTKYLNTFINWLKGHFSCAYNNANCVSLATGFIADSNTNCDQAAAESITGKKHIQNTSAAHRQGYLFSCSRNFVRVRGQDINIDPHHLWHRLSLLIKNNKDRELYFAFKLAPEPTCLFKQGFMRKNTKSCNGCHSKRRH